MSNSHTIDRYLKTMMFVLMVVLLQSCEGSSQDDVEITAIVQAHYDDDPFFEKPRISVPLVQDVEGGNKAIIVKIDSATYSYGFVTGPAKNFKPIGEITAKEDKIVHAANWGISIAETKEGKTTGNFQDYSIVMAILPATGFEGYDRVKMAWDCEDEQTTPLIDGRFFMLVKPKKGARRCDRFELLNKDGKFLKIVFDAAKGRFKVDNEGRSQTDIR